MTTEEHLDYFVCEICKEAATTKGWKKAYKWKTARGFFNHQCFKNEEEISEEDFILNLRKDNPPNFLIGDRVFYLKKFAAKYKILCGDIIEETPDDYVIKGETVSKYNVFATPKDAKLAIRALEERAEKQWTKKKLKE